jgi:hypothetical protein
MIIDGFDRDKDPSPKSQGVSMGVIVGAAIGGLVVLLALALTTLCCLRPSLFRRHRSQKDVQLQVDPIYSPMEPPSDRDVNVCPSCYVTAYSFCRDAHFYQVQNSFYAQNPLSSEKMRNRMMSDPQLAAGLPSNSTQHQPRASGQVPVEDLVELVYQRLQQDRPEYSERATTELPVYEERGVISRLEPQR